MAKQIGPYPGVIAALVFIQPGRLERGGDPMNRWATLAATLALAALAAAPNPAGAQAKDTLTVALVSHPPTLDPHMHFERVGVLVNINMFDSLLHRNTKLEF